SLGLYAALLAEMVALLEDRGLVALAVAVCLFLCTLNLTLLVGLGAGPPLVSRQPVPLPVVSAIVVPVFLVVVLCTLLIVHQRRVHTRTVHLLQELELAHGELAASTAQ